MFQKHKHIITTTLNGSVIAGLTLSLLLGLSAPHNGSAAPAPYVALTPPLPALSKQTIVPIGKTDAPTSTVATATTNDTINSHQGQHVYQALGDLATPLYQTEPFINRISATSAWGAYDNNGPAPVIAVIDTGFALNNQYLSSRWDGTQGTASWKGWDFVDNDNNPSAGRTDPNGTGVFHGTMTAGLVGLLDPNAKIMPLQALSDEGVGYTNDIAAAVDYAANNGANVISMSLGSTANDPALQTAIDSAISKGILVVAAAGNDGCNCMDYPGNYPEVLSVGASTGNDLPASFSSYGANLDVLAPGTTADVCSSVYTAANPTTAYTCGYSGTSFATPLVSGLAALLLQASTTASPAQLISAIENGADKLPGMNGQTRTSTYGYGRIDVAGALRAIAPATTTYSGASQTVCVGFPGATCDLTLVGPSNQRVDLGSQLTDQFGGAYYSWNTTTLGLAAGQWQLETTLSAAGETITLPSQTVTISP